MTSKAYSSRIFGLAKQLSPWRSNIGEVRPVREYDTPTHEGVTFTDATHLNNEQVTILVSQRSAATGPDLCGG